MHPQACRVGECNVTEHKTTTLWECWACVLLDSYSYPSSLTLLFASCSGKQYNNHLAHQHYSSTVDSEDVPLDQ